MWPNKQTHFAAALLDPDRVPPVSKRGFNVYRNNVAVSLNSALAETFPVIKSLVGDAFFEAMAGVYLRSSIPTSPILAERGADFPAFLETFEPAGSLPYLADIARLEWGWIRAYHAADASPVSMDILSGLHEVEYEQIRLDLHPSLCVISSPWPVVSIWQAHQGGGQESGLEDLPENGETGVILRPGLEVHVHDIAAGEAALIKACLANNSLSEAVEAASVCGDPSSSLVTLFQHGAFIGTRPLNYSRDKS